MPLPDKITRQFLGQAKASDELKSPFMALLCRLLPARLDPAASRFERRLAEWKGDPQADAVSLRAAGGLHALARSGHAPVLTSAYPPNPTDIEALWSAVRSAIAAEDGFLTGYLDSPPQTNEVARSSAILGGCLLVARSTGLPLEVFEIGSSAGLNLGFDQYRYDLGNGVAWGPDSPVHIASRWDGAPPPLDQPLAIAARAGCDVTPLDPGSASDRARLMSYIWPDQPIRLARTEAALDLAAARPERVVRVDAAEWIERGLSAAPRKGVVRVILHTIMWQYMPIATRDRIARRIRQAAAEATSSTPLAWLSMEPDAVEGSAAIRLTIWPGGATRHLGRAHFHGAWVRWEGAQLP